MQYNPFQSFMPGAQMTCWEYEIKEIRTERWEDTKEDLNSMGLDGWELVKFAGPLDTIGSSNAFFKRPIDKANA
jgi:hypothetical protein